MASIRKRSGRWQVQVRRKGCPPINRTFSIKADAVAWARQMDIESDRRGLAPDPKVLKRVTVAEILRRCRDEIVPAKRSCRSESGILKAMLDQKLVRITLSDLKPAMVSRYRDARLKLVKPATVVRELGLIQHALEIARREWAIPLAPNPVAAVRRPKLSNRRERRLRPGEWERLDAACARSRNPVLHTRVRFALETGMRRGELLNAEWRDVRLESRTLLIPVTKNGDSRTTLLTRRAVELLRERECQRPNGDDRIFPSSSRAVRAAWEYALRRANIDDLHFHDLRHEAISRFFERNLTVPEVASISGHRDARMLLRYAHVRKDVILAKLDD